MSISVTETNGVKSYNLSFGKTAPEFLRDAQKKKTSLKYNNDYRNHIELIKDFGFPISSQDLVLTNDNQYAITCGIYKPSVKIFELSSLALKCSRGIDSEIIKIQMLGDSWQKFALACNDRNIELHAQYGRHFKIRVPKTPRDMVYNNFTCDLQISNSTEEIFRLNLEEGRFMSTFHCKSPGIDSMVFNQKLNVLLAGGENGFQNIFDYRVRENVGQIQLLKGQDQTQMKLHEDGLQLACGSAEGLLRLYDLRFNEPIFSKQHPYMMPIKGIEFHKESNKIISADSNSLR